jgi:hypothetical protein
MIWVRHSRAELESSTQLSVESDTSVKSSAMMIFFLLIFVFVRNVASDSVLLLGDSIDRHTVLEWCELKRKQGIKTISSEWGASSLKYSNIHGRQASFFCSTMNDSVAFVHIFGSNATGPYRKHFGNGEVDPYENTNARLNLSISLYQSKFGAPGRIIFHTGLWDVGNLQIYRFTRKAMELFSLNTNLRIEEIQHMVGKGVDVGLRTAAYSAASAKLTTIFNKVIRQIANEKNLTLYDLDHDVWSTVDFDYSLESTLFRDYVHPKPAYLNSIGEKLLGHQFTNSIRFANKTAADAYEKRFQIPFSNSSTVYLWQNTLTNTTLYINYMNKTIHEVASKDILHALRLGSSDVHRYSGAFPYSDYPLSTPTPTFFLDEELLCEANTHRLFYYRKFALRLIRDTSIVIGIGKNLSQIVEVGDKDSFWFSLVQHEPAIPECYNRSTPWLMRHEHENKNHTYLIKDGFRFNFDGHKILASLKKSFGNFVVLGKEHDEDLLPLSNVILK